MKKEFGIGVVVIAIIAALPSFYNSLPQSSFAVVTRVIDGDTIVVEGGERVRLLDIDTAETGEPCYREAKDRLAELIDGQKVRLETNGLEDKDQYGRLLRYVFLEDTNINLLMVEEGLANLYIVNKAQYYNQMRSAEHLAKSEAGCVWE